MMQDDQFDIQAYRERLAAALGTEVEQDENAQDVGAGPDINPQDPSTPPGQNAPDMGAGPDLSGDDSGQGAPQAAAAPPQGGGPDISPAPATAAPQSLSTNQQAIVNSTPTLNQFMPGPDLSGQPQGRSPGLAPQAPGAPTAPTAPRAPTAPTAGRASTAPTAPTAAATPDLGDESQRRPANEHKNGSTLADGRPGIQVHPDGFDPGDQSNYNTSQLQTLQKTEPNPTPGQVFDAMKPKVQTTYMDWWEKQHGDIEQRYNQMQQGLGIRPDPNAQPDRKEQFKMLMNFGISLMQGSGRGQDQGANAGNALRTALNTGEQDAQAKTADWDKQSAAIQAAKQNDLKDIGNYGNAVREDALITDANTRTAIAQAKAMAPPKPGAPTTRILSNGTQVEYDPTTKSWNPSHDSTGKPLGPMPLQGPKGGAAGHTSSMVQQVQDLTAHGVPYAQAVQTVYKIKPSGDPAKTYVSIYNQERRNGADPDDAAATAKNQTEAVHGAGALTRQQSRDTTTLVPSAKPPAGAVPPGKQVTFKNGSTWKNENGVLTQVQ